jgi:heme oxygenase
MSRQLLTPSPSPPPPVPTPTLPAQINAATRKQHTELNRLIIDRLALALPPKASSPLLLGRGFSAFAQLFFMFEKCWKELYDSVEAADTTLSGTHNAQVRRWLATLIPPELVRSARLRQDLEFISSRTGVDVRQPSIFERVDMLDTFRESIRARPHILIAYGWVMYMAIFSGGRWVRQQLANAGVEFWTGDNLMNVDSTMPQDLDVSGFSFLSFDEEDDGEDLKALFKARLAEAETLLLPHERQDIIIAAQNTFRYCILQVRYLDFALWLEGAWMKILMVLLSIAVAIWAFYGRC